MLQGDTSVRTHAPWHTLLGLVLVVYSRSLVILYEPGGVRTVEIQRANRSPVLYFAEFTNCQGFRGPRSSIPMEYGAWWAVTYFSVGSCLARFVKRQRLPLPMIFRRADVFGLSECLAPQPPSLSSFNRHCVSTDDRFWFHIDTLLFPAPFYQTRSNSFSQEDVHSL